MATGGFSNELVDEASPRLYCIICNFLIKETMQLQCGHVFCHSCIRKLDETSIQRYIIFELPLSFPGFFEFQKCC